MSGQEIRRAFLEFYAARGHKILPSSSLVPEDPTVLLTIAGAHNPLSFVLQLP
jgi:alanyl-tRNA synthetase